ncbi:calcium-binding protein [Tropicibacter oceani]|uniref:Calcium-binding protein n=1 Tax=Tropicibacter oceani TaxID=3058420 RepID=A0ABY8QGL9_9RHOB|nr:calcium-binding protein [Tropicibacter oceani]WGW03669.1 calcium-binding protein [Tropicibacter oceani]
MCADTVLNTTPDWTSSHTFSTDDITGTFDGLTQGDLAPGDNTLIDFSATPKITTEGVDLYPINSDFGFIVTDFEGAIEKDFYENPEHLEGFAGDLNGEGGEHIGLVISDAPTDTFKTPATLGTWLMGIGGSFEKASTEHYSVMQSILSDQMYPGDPLAKYPLDDELYVIGGQYDGMLLSDAIVLEGDSNGDGVADLKDVLQPNESTITENIAASSDYSITVKDDGKVLYRWGNAIKRPNDVRLEATLDLPDEWTTADPETPDLAPLYRITAAELVVNHTITNNPNDQIRPEDYENESAIGQLPTYEVLPDGKWVSTDDYYAGDGTFYPAGTVLKDPALAAAAAASPLAAMGALSEDLLEGYTAAWYTTMDREPFEADLDENGEYIVGPRWRLQPDKYGQDLPSVVIPEDPSLPPPPTKDQVKYDVGEDTTTVINLLDWENPISPLSISAGYTNLSGTTSINGMNYTDGLDVAFYVKGDIKPATLYNTQLVMSYEEITIHDANVAINGTAESDYLVGQGGNTFAGGAGEDLFVVSYGVSDEWTDIQASVVTDFEVGVDTIGIIDFDINEFNFLEVVSQAVVGGNLVISVGGVELVTLNGVTEPLTYDDFLLLDRSLDGALVGDTEDNHLVGDQWDNVIMGDAGNDTLMGLDGDDTLTGGQGADSLDGGEGSDTTSYLDAPAAVGVYLDGTPNTGAAVGDVFVSIENVLGSNYADTISGNDDDNILYGADGNDTLSGLAGDDILVGGEGDDSLMGMDDDDVLSGGLGADVMNGGNGDDTITYEDSTKGAGARLDGGVNWGAALGDTIQETENLKGGIWADTFVGSTGDNVLDGGIGWDTLWGNSGDDTLLGGRGNDKLYGQNDNDVLIGGVGADTMVGGAGVDTISYEDATSNVGARLDGGANWGAAVGDVISEAEALLGSSFNDVLVGNTGANELDGSDGNDVLWGQAGNDSLIGGEGDDVLYGQQGSDTFVFEDHFGNDTIKDFAALDVNEKIDLSGVASITDFTDLSTTGHMYQVGADVIINDFSGNTITLENISITNLDSSDFIF